MARHWIGTSGWTYSNWKGEFYPGDVKQREWLGYYARHLRTVEINATFYRLPRESMLQGWLERTPDDFVFAVKAWRVVTHYRRLADCAEAVAEFFARIEPLWEKCGVVLFQLPPRYPADVDRLDAFLAGLPAGRRYALEFRDPDWHGDAVYETLARHNAAFCPFDLAGLTAPRVATADFVYVRLHGHEQRYRGAYTEAQLAGWAGWLGGQLDAGRDVFVYFDNTDEAAHAIDNARRLDTLLAEHKKGSAE